MSLSHRWQFFRAGGFDQVQLNSGADLLALRQLDQKLWVALSCPTRGIEFDNATLDLIDADADGHVRANELLAAIDWAAARLKNADLLVKASDTLALKNITESPDGRQILAAAQAILVSLGKPQATEISLSEVSGIEAQLTQRPFNGDGVICASQVESASLHLLIQTIEKTLGSVPDVSGGKGVNQDLVEQFFTQASAALAWRTAGEAVSAELPSGLNELAVSAFQAVKEKVEDYFVRCQMAAFDARSAMPLSRSVEDFIGLAGMTLSAQSAELAAFPLAAVAADKPLPLQAGVNPVWQSRLENFYRLVLLPHFGEMNALTLAQWRTLSESLTRYEAWQNSKPASAVTECEVDYLREVLSGDAAQQLNALIEKDKAVADQLQAIHCVKRLLRYQRDLYRLLNNFVSFREFYSGQSKAIFQVGTLYLDARSCDLCVRVEDINAHAAYANSSGVCLAYCNLVRKDGEKMNIAAAFTAGDSDYLIVGRHGVFYDGEGRDWNATIVRISDHPISIRQAFWSPFKKAAAAISDQMQKFAASKANAGHEDRLKTVSAVASSVAASNAPNKPSFDVAKFAGIFAALGLAIGAIGGILASVVAGILSLKLWQMPFAFIGLLLVISGPSMILAWFKLKRRNLGPILDACGWAINARVLINIPFGTSLTAMPNLPLGAHRSLVDPYAEEKSRLPYILAAVAVLFTVWMVYLLMFRR
jgi:hypothetical protein